MYLPRQRRIEASIPNKKVHIKMRTLLQIGYKETHFRNDASYYFDKSYFLKFPTLSVDTK